MEKMTLPAELDNLELMLKVILENAEVVGFNKKDLFQIRLASEEALVNIINHAYPKGRPGAIELTIVPKPKESLELVFADSGKPFDPLSLPKPNVCAPMEERQIGGLGVYLMCKVMDKVSYKREDGRNVLTVIKKLKPKK